MKKLTELSEEKTKEYLAKKGIRCPFCKSDKLEGQPGIEVEGDECSQQIICYDCGANWYDIYKLTGVLIFED